MKYRQGFVSNSSSSSFIIVTNVQYTLDGNTWTEAAHGDDSMGCYLDLEIDLTKLPEGATKIRILGYSEGDFDG